jgi:hypothetical protein
VTDLQKYEFKDSKGDNKYDFLQIEKKLKEKLKNLGIFEIFILWENMVYNSSSSVVNEFSRFVEFNDSWNDKLKQIFYKLAEAWASKRLNNNSSQDIIRNAFFTFGGIFADTFEKNIHQEPEESYNQMDFSSLKSEVEKEVKGKINSRLLVDRSQLDGLYPGNVYENNRETHIKESLSTGGNAMKIEEIKNKSIPVIIEVSPLCDFVQDKMKLSRIVEGFLCPVEVQINGTTIQTYKELKSSTHFLYISPVIEHEEKLYRLVIDFRYFSANSIDEINENTPIFRLRKDILIDIQTKLSSHINRPGVLFIE